MTKKQKAEFARCYHSIQRVEWIKSLPSVASGAYDTAFDQIDNVHVKGGGMGRKADYCWIVQLRRTEHMTLHQRGPSQFFDQYGVNLIQKAIDTEVAWQDFVRASAYIARSPGRPVGARDASKRKPRTGAPGGRKPLPDSALTYWAAAQRRHRAGQTGKRGGKRPGAGRPKKSVQK